MPERAHAYQDLGYERILVALDGSDRQLEVLDRAILMARNDGAELAIGHVIDPGALEASDAAPEGRLGALERDFRASIASRVAGAEADPDIRSVQVIVGTGRIRETLREEMLDVVRPDLVICGARSLSSISYAKLGSISTFLTRSTDCDVLIVK